MMISDMVKWLVMVIILTAIVFAVVSWVMILFRKYNARSLSGTVPSDQSFPFSADDILAKEAHLKYTVFEFQVDSGNNPEVNLTSFSLTPEDGEIALAGDYKLQGKEADSTKFTFTNTSRSISIDFTRLPAGKLTVTKDSPVTFVILSLPRAYNGLSVTFRGDPIGRKTLKLAYADGSPITFEAMKRHRINGLSLPNE